MFHELDVVLIKALRSESRPVDGTEGVRREPLVGDRGIVVHVLGRQEYTVESVDDSGLTIWLADFVEDELASPPHGWKYTVEEISAGAFRAVAVGPGNVRADATDVDPSVALASCREFALRCSKGPPAGGAG